MDTHFAASERAGSPELQREIEAVNVSPVIDALLHSVFGMIAILNVHRQIVALNDRLLRELGIVDPGAVLGLRPGDVLSCLHADEEEGGCGTSRYCSSCGAAIAIVTSLCLDEPAERVCALTAERDGRQVDICLLVSAGPVRIAGERYVFLMLKDITRDWSRASLERSFFHDINNMLCGLTSATSLLDVGHVDPELVVTIKQLSARITREVAVQAKLHGGDGDVIAKMPEKATVGGVLAELKSLYGNHPAARGKSIDLRVGNAEADLETDVSLLLRVLGNMTLNALEATDDGGSVVVSAAPVGDRIVFRVRNRGCLEEGVARRVFQRNFSTKGGEGRGLGTYAMKLLGESILGGEVDFVSTEADGTEFRYTLPARQGEARGEEDAG